MKFLLKRVLAVAFLAAFALAHTANAEPILAFGQNGPGTLSLSTSGSTTTISTTSTLTPGFIPITISSIGTASTNIQALYSVTATTTGAASSVGGTVTQDAYSGTIQILTQTAMANILTTTFTGATLNGPLGGTSAVFSASTPGDTVNFTTADPNIIAILGGTTGEGSLGLSFSSLTPGLGVTGTTLNSTVATTNSGTFATGVIPEPSSVVMAGISAVVGLGCCGLRRFKASQAA